MSIGAALAVRWGVFSAGIGALLILDLFFMPRRATAPSLLRAGLACGLWLSLALMFALGLALFDSSSHAAEFLTGYFIEEALSIDNLFIFLLIFEQLNIPTALQPQVLKWGIFGALAMRATFIFAGGALLGRFHQIFYILGMFLLFTAVRLLMPRRQRQLQHENKSPVSPWMMRLFPWPITPSVCGPAFFVQQGKRRMATPLALALCAVEMCDVVFALDSVPAIFAITTDTFIIYTSNVFAMLGLRSLYFLLAGMLHKFSYLHVGLGLILAFIGGKMLLHTAMPIGPSVSLACVLGILGLTLAASWLRAAPKMRTASHGHVQYKGPS